MNIGIHFTTDLQRVKRAAETPLSHAPSQAAPALPVIWMVLENLCKIKNPFVRAISLFASLLIRAVLRPRHLQRSIITFNNTSVIGWVHKGKRRVRGQQVPMQWATSRVGVTNEDILESLSTHMELAQCANKQRPYLVPEFIPAGTDFNTARAFGDAPMDPSTIRRQLSLALRAAGVLQEIIDMLEGLYSFRRVLPTLAHRAAFNVSERLDVGAWVSKEEKAEAAMPQLYSEAKLTMQALKKAELIFLANQTFTTILGNSDVSINFNWELAFAKWPDRPKNFTHTFDASASSIKPLKDLDKVAPESNSFSSDGSGSSSGDSDISDMFGSETDNDRAAEDELYPACLNDIEWQLAAGPKGRLHLSSGGHLCCGRTLRLPEHGVSLSNAYSANREWSPRCWQQLPALAQTWWKDST